MYHPLLHHQCLFCLDTLIQPYQYFKNIPTNSFIELTNISSGYNFDEYITSNPIIEQSSNIHVYSFCLNPQDISQPSGACNMSKIIDQVLYIVNPHNENLNINIYGMNHNIVRFKSGQIFLKYNI